MKIEKTKLKSVHRKNFFKTAGIGLSGLFLFQFSPMKYFVKKESSSKMKVTINPFSVKRESTGVNNV